MTNCGARIIGTAIIAAASLVTLGFGSGGDAKDFGLTVLVTAGVLFLIDWWQTFRGEGGERRDR